MGTNIRFFLGLALFCVVERRKFVRWCIFFWVLSFSGVVFVGNIGLTRGCAAFREVVRFRGDIVEWVLFR